MQVSIRFLPMTPEPGTVTGTFATQIAIDLGKKSIRPGHENLGKLTGMPAAPGRN